MLMRKEIDDSVAIASFNNVSLDLAEHDVYKAMQKRVNGIQNTKIGMPVPAIKTIATLDGKEFDMASLRGKYVLIDFWGVWCAPCIAEMPKIQEFQKRFPDKLAVLGINSGDTQERMQKFLDEKGYTWQQIRSTNEINDDNFVTRFNVQGFPTKLIIDPEGKIVKRYSDGEQGAFKLLEDLLRSEI